MTIKHIKIFITVFQANNITKAATLLHMAQPAVSRSIQELEQYYGIPLFERLNKRLSPTEGGKYLYSKSVHIIDSLDTLEKELKDWNSTGVLRIGAGVTIGNTLIPSLAKEFTQMRLSLDLRVNITNSTILQQDLLQNNIDLALIEGKITTEELHAEQFSMEHLVLITMPSHPLLKNEVVTVKDIAQYNFLSREAGSSVRKYLDYIFALHHSTIHPIWESTSTQAIINGVSCGVGISILPFRLVEDDLKSGIISTCSIEDENFQRPLSIVWHKNKYLTKVMKDFIQFCKERED